MSKTNSNSLQELSYEEMRYIHEKKNIPELSDFDEVVNNGFIKSIANLSLSSISEQPVEEEIQGKQEQKQREKEIRRQERIRKWEQVWEQEQIQRWKQEQEREQEQIRRWKEIRRQRWKQERIRRWKEIRRQRWKEKEMRIRRQEQERIRRQEQEQKIEEVQEYIIVRPLTTERQWQGKTIERQVIKVYCNFDDEKCESISHTSHDDVSAEDNPHGNYPISVKSRKAKKLKDGSISEAISFECANPSAFLNSLHNHVEIIGVLYVDNTGSLIIDRTYVIRFPENILELIARKTSIRKEIFLLKIRNMEKYMKNLPLKKDVSTEREKNEITIGYKSRVGEIDNDYIKFHPKWGGGNRRLQCSFKMQNIKDIPGISISRYQGGYIGDLHFLDEITKN